MLQHRLAPLLAYTWYGVQLRGNHGLPTLFTVEGDSEPMHLILNPLQQIKFLTIPSQSDRFWRISNQKLSRLMLIILDETTDRNE
ncbi:hypothetical protein D3C71_1235680 [compost metagenome]